MKSGSFWLGLCWFKIILKYPISNLINAASLWQNRRAWTLDRERFGMYGSRKGLQINSHLFSKRILLDIFKKKSGQKLLLAGFGTKMLDPIIIRKKLFWLENKILLKYKRIKWSPSHRTSLLLPGGWINVFLRKKSLYFFRRKTLLV